MSVKNMDDIFEEIYGFKPIKRGAGYELLVGAVLKILNRDANVTHNVFVPSLFSDDEFQIDNLLESVDSSFVEVKDIAKKVGRPDVTKLSGALLNLPIDKGIIASAIGFTKNAKQYAKDCLKNPKAKPIDLYMVRTVLDKDLEGRIQGITIKLTILSMDYSKAVFTPRFQKGAMQKLGYAPGETVQFQFLLDSFYKEDGAVIETLANLTRELNKGPVTEGSYIGKWEFPEPTFIPINGTMVGISHTEYNIPLKVEEKEIKISLKPLLIVRSQDGTIDKIISEEELMSIKFEKQGGSFIIKEK